MKKLNLITGILLNIVLVGCGDISTSSEVKTINGMMWQDNINVTNNSRTYQNAITYCQNLTLGGYSNWRLPTQSEFNSIVDKKRNPSLVIEIENFPKNDGNGIAIFATSTEFTRVDKYSFDYISAFSIYEGRWVDVMIKDPLNRGYESLYVRCIRDI